MPFIAFLGCDGSGKSAVIQAITHQLEGNGQRVIRGHWRPQSFASTGAESSAADDPHGQQPRGLVASILKLGWLGSNWWAGWFRQLRRDSRNSYLIFDRYHADLLVDPVRYRYGGPQALARLASRWMPQPDRVIFLDAPPSVLLSRKQEVDEASLERSRAGYLQLCRSHPRFKIVDASRPLEDVVADVMAIVRDAG